MAPKKTHSLQAVPDPEPSTDTPPTEATRPYTVEDAIRRNFQLLSELIDEYNFDHQAAANIFAITLNYHITKIQLGLSAPVEG